MYTVLLYVYRVQQLSRYVFFQYYRRPTAAASLDLNKIFKCIIHQWSAVYNDNSRNL